METSYWIALQYSRDQHFSEARDLWLDRAHELVTTNHVIGETWTFLRRRVGHSVAANFVRLAETSVRLQIVHVDEAAEREAWTWLHRHDERVYSFVDATSFTMMRKLGIFEVLASDGDFSAAGFVEVRP